MALRGKAPTADKKRLKMMLYGIAGVGKTMAALQFPDSYIIDMEKGTDHYMKSITKNDSAVFNTVDPDEVREECLELLTTKHSYRTLAIDPMTVYYGALQEKWNRRFERKAKSDGKEYELADFGMRFWGKVKSEYKSLLRIISQLDMNVILIYHQKDLYDKAFNKLGVGFDGAKGDNYFVDWAFRIEPDGANRLAIKDKERAEIGEPKFPDTFPWSYKNFVRYYGKEIIERESVPVKIATDVQVKKFNDLKSIIKIDDTVVQKWYDKSKVDGPKEMESAIIQKCIGWMEEKIKMLGGKK